MKSADGYVGLAVAIFMRAVDDIHLENAHAEDARAFLASGWAAELTHALGMDPEAPARLAGQSEIPKIPNGCITSKEARRILGLEQNDGNKKLREMIDNGVIGVLRKRTRGGRIPQRLFWRADIERVVRWKRIA